MAAQCGGLETWLELFKRANTFCQCQEYILLTVLFLGWFLPSLAGLQVYQDVVGHKCLVAIQLQARVTES